MVEAVKFLDLDDRAGWELLQVHFTVLLKTWKILLLLESLDLVDFEIQAVAYVFQYINWFRPC